MTEALREQAQFRKAKAPIIRAYLNDHEKLFAEIAGRGFLALPGYAYDAENSLEMGAKTALSEVNFKILSETIDRELKQVGIVYNNDFRAASLAWEIAKQALLDAWASEYAGIKQGMAISEEILNRLAVEVSKRAVTLLEAKTAIEIEAEGLRQTLATLDGSTAPYEVQLANAKLLTAQRKLLLIPVIEQIIAKEQELLVIEQQKAAEYTTYIGAEQEVSTKKGTLIPFVNELASLSQRHAEKVQTVQIPIEGQIAAEKVAQSEAAVRKAGYQVDELTAEIETAGKNIDLQDAKRTLEETRFENEQGLITTETDLTRTYQEDQSGQFETLLGEERSAQENLIADKTEVHTIKSDTRVTSATTLANEERSSDYRKTLAEVDKEKAIAIVNAAAKITASLTHVIG